MSAAFVIPWKLANQSGRPEVSVLVMLGVGACLSTAAQLWSRRGLMGLLSLRVLIVAAQLALLTLLGNIAQAHAIVSLSPSVLSVALRSEVLLIAVIAWIWLGERVDAKFWLAAVLSAVGLLFMREPEAAQATGLSGLALALLAATAFGVMAVVLRRHVAEVDLPSLNSLRLWLSVLLWLAANGGPPDMAAVPSSQYGYAALAALFGPFMARLMMMASARHLEARLTALIALSAPVFALLLSWLFLGDVPTLPQLWGGGIMLVGIAVPAWSRREPLGRASD